MTFALRTFTGPAFLVLVATVAAREPSAGSACTLEGASNCQTPPRFGEFGFGAAHISDLTVPPNGVVSADDFVPTGDTLAQLCVWGYYSSGLGATSSLFGCQELVDDEFRIRVYGDAGGLPGALIGESLSTYGNIVRAPAPDLDYTAMYPIQVPVPFGHTLRLDTPIVGLVPGERHWLEVANNTTGPTAAAKTCWWNWLQHYPQVGDGYSATGANSDGVDDPYTYLTGQSRYIHGSARMSDLAFCLGTTNGPLAFDSGPPVLAACWTCVDTGDPTCTVETALDCVSIAGVDGIWNRLDPDCSGTMEDAGELILGDTCTDPLDGARVITDGLYAMNTNCANTDGSSDFPGPVKGDGYVGHDMWFHYTATCTGLMTVNACPTQPGITQNGYDLSDGVLALYHDPDNPGECVCPGDSNAFELVPASDEGCNGIQDAGAGILSRLVLPGECYTIRMTNWGSTAATAGSGPAMFDVDCPIVVHPPDPPQPELIPGDFGAMEASTKNRFLSFDVPSGTTRSVAVRVTFVDLPRPYDLWNGRSMWVDEPGEVSACSGLCGPGPPPPPFMMATLRCGSATYRNWRDVGIVHVYHEGIVPGGTYRVDVEDERLPLSFSEPLDMTTARFGDTVETCSTLGCTPPDGYIGIDDALAILARFASVSGSIILPRADLEPACVDFAINVSDVLHSLRGFTGQAYPFVPSTADPCDATCTGP